MKLLQLMAGGKAGGAELFFTRLVCALDERKVDQCLVVRKHQVRNSIFRDRNIPLHEIRYGNIFDFNSRNRLKNIAGSYQPDIVLSWMNRASLFSPAGPWKNVGRLGGYYDLKYYKNCRYLVCNTTDICDYVTALGWPASNVTYIPNFVDEAWSPPVNRSDFNTPPDVPLIASVGRLHQNKAVDTLVAAMAKVDRAYLWIAGTGPEETRLVKMVKELGLQDRIRFLGWQDNVTPVFTAADIFVCPSRHEPLGNVVLEAWAQGTPVIAASSAGPGALITDGINGLLVPVDDPAKLADAINRLVLDKNLASSLVQAGSNTYAERFSKKIVVDKYLRFFSEILSG